ncbi:hypothetical protein FB554_1109 [Barrientosiimonas humi]|uniref:ATP-dependent DNA helicase RecG n=2 Tax=Barrientosiimonas TaxID=1535207 RepID=A0A542XB54_9MICO|nr:MULTISPECIES: OB-fold nucleic acid binding domain-containing protein [Barrientosiimonas]TQL32976.1 hypothetical protein FB554_1109 [Barrientosiimonas humi]BDZ57819.1 hypothetical protein GCM10025872_14760 [Barrientosiimonas endolithica]CAG7572966.1 hypothetical protein BH39T_PBIAJDOK_01590 [Barrientosiimonas humi]
MPTRHEAGWRKVLGRLTRPDEQLEAEEKRETSAQLGGTPICDVHDRELAQVCGEVRAVSVRPRSDQVPALVVDLDDGSQAMRLVWLGRRHIAGIEPGRYLKASGRVCVKGGVPTIFNPTYELKTGGRPPQ